MSNPGEDRNFPLYRRGTPVSLSELRRVDELAHSLERTQVTGDGGITAQTGIAGPSIGFNTSPGYQGFAAIILGQDVFHQWMYSFRPLLEQPYSVNGPTPLWVGDNNFFLYPNKTYNAMEGNYRLDVPFDRQPFLTLSQPATSTALSNEITVSTANGFKPLSFVITGDVTAGSDTVENLSTTYTLAAGQSVSGTGIPNGTTITGVSLLGATVWMVPSAVPDFFTFYYFERVMPIFITGPLITDPTQPGYGYYPALESVWNTATLTWGTGDAIYYRDANM